MDNTVLPDFRAWISPPVVLGPKMQKLLDTSFELGFDQKFDESAAKEELVRISNKEAAPAPDNQVVVVEAPSAAPAPDNRVMIVDNGNGDVEMQDNGDAEMEEPINENLIGYVFKSGPTRLISGDDRYKEHMDRAVKEDWKFAEQYRENHMRLLGIDGQTFDRLQKMISPTSASVRGEAFQDNPLVAGAAPPILIPPVPDADRVTLKSMTVLFCNTNPTATIWKSNNVQQILDDDVSVLAKQKEHLQRLNDRVTGNLNLLDNTKDFIIEVNVCHGRNPNETLPTDVKVVAEPKTLYKLDLLGTNTVADLRKAIHCDNELAATGEVESPDDVIRPQILKDETAEWIMLLDDTIYSENNEQGPCPRLLNWAAEYPTKNLGPFKKGSNDTMLKDLVVRLGYPYVFCHIDKCEHIIVFIRARVVKKIDEQRIEEYPVPCNLPTLRNIYCQVDNDHMATWCVKGCPIFAEDPSYYCTYCLRKLFYRQDGTKRMQFQLFPFRQLANEI